jgi:hypothetical protein
LDSPPLPGEPMDMIEWVLVLGAAFVFATLMFPIEEDDE